MRRRTSAQNIGLVGGEGVDGPSQAARWEWGTEPLNALRCAGVPIVLLSRAEATRILLQCAMDKPTRAMDVHLCNAYTLALADKNDSYRDLLNHSALNLPDGMSVVWVSRLLHRGKHPIPTQVRGSNLFLDVFEAGSQRRLRHYLLGSTPEVLEALTNRLCHRFPGVQIVGTESPPFRDLTDIERDEQLDRIVTSGAQVVWVGLGTPKQDIEVARLASELSLVVIAIGAAFDFVSGNKAEAPVWMQRAGVEWLHRLISEPRRLWRRYLLGNIRFLKAVIFRR